MEYEIAQTIYEKVKDMPLSEQEQVLEFIEERTSSSHSRDARPIWDVIVEMSSQVPDELWAELPVDGSINHDHYLYGAPKKNT